MFIVAGKKRIAIIKKKLRNHLHQLWMSTQHLGRRAIQERKVVMMRSKMVATECDQLRLLKVLIWEHYFARTGIPLSQRQAHASSSRHCSNITETAEAYQNAEFATRVWWILYTGIFTKKLLHSNWIYGRTSWSNGPHEAYHKKHCFGSFLGKASFPEGIQRVSRIIADANICALSYML